MIIAKVRKMSVLFNIISAILAGFAASIIVIYIIDRLKGRKLKKAKAIIWECAAIKNHGVDIDFQMGRLKDKDVLFCCKKQ